MPVALVDLDRLQSDLESLHHTVYAMSLELREAALDGQDGLEPTMLDLAEVQKTLSQCLTDVRVVNRS